MLTKIWTIAWNGIYRTYTDRVALLFMILIPLVLSTIMGLAFGTGDNDVELPDSKVIIINHDQGAETAAGDTVNLGQDIFVTLFVEDTPEGLDELIEGEIGDDLSNAKGKVEDGDARAVIEIPENFSQSIFNGDEAVELYIYYNPSSSIGATIVLSVVDQLITNLNAGQVAQDVLVGSQEDAGYFINLMLENGAFDTEQLNQLIEQEIQPIYVGAATLPIQINSQSVEGERQEFDALQYFAPSMAILFMTFAMAGGTRMILEEQRTWTLQRILTTPTPRWVYMFGRLLGTFVAGVLQMLILLIVTPIVAVALGRDADLWGNNYVGLALITIAVVAAGTGLGLVFAAISKNVRQADGLANAVLILMALVGGTFVQTDNVPVLDALSNISLNKWGLTGFTELAVNNAATSEIIINVAVLLAMAAAFFSIALWRFSQRLDV